MVRAALRPRSTPAPKTTATTAAPAPAPAAEPTPAAPLAAAEARALAKPIRTIAENGGVDGAVVVDEVTTRAEPASTGYNAATGEYVVTARVFGTSPDKTEAKAALRVDGKEVGSAAVTASDPMLTLSAPLP